MKCKIFVFRLNFKTSNNFMNRKNFFNEMICLSPQCIRWKNRKDIMCMRINKRKVLCCLSGEDYLRPVEISGMTGLHINTVSKELRLLREEGLVVCLNPEYYRPRLYRLTSKGKKKIEKS